LDFGVEKHDDAVDALVHLIFGWVQGGIEEHRVHYVWARQQLRVCAAH
jgi:hypothetical protein